MHEIAESSQSRAANTFAMAIIPRTASCLAVALLLPGCAASLDQSPIDGREERAVEILDRAADVQGGAFFSSLRDLSVSYDGTWHSSVERFQPELVDIEYRGKSEERILLSNEPPFVAQRHAAADRVKFVTWDGTAVDVRYDGAPNEDEIRDDAAAAVAEAYLMFLTAPHFLLRRGDGMAMSSTARVDGRACDQVLVVLRPGLGRSIEDRVLVAVDRETGAVRRLRFSFNGLDSTRNALVDVVLREHRVIDGMLWPTRFEETVRRPIQIMVHRWWITGLDADRGMTRAELAGPDFEGSAAAPARPLPAD